MTGNGILQVNDFTNLAENVCKKLNYTEGEKEQKIIAQKSVKFFRKLLRDIPNPGYQVINKEEWLEFFDVEIVNNEDDDSLDEWAN